MSLCEYHGYGGAISNTKGTVTLINSILIKNKAMESGGAIENNDIFTTSDTIFTKNTALENGGAIKNNGELTIKNSQLTKNTSFSSAGAIYNKEDGNITTQRVLFDNNNSVEKYANDVYNYGNLKLDEITFGNNTKSILNINHISLHVESKQKIYNMGYIHYLEYDESQKNFTYLDELIRGGQKEIQLEYDIVFG